MASPNDSNKLDRLVRLVNAGITINGTTIPIGGSASGVIGATGPKTSLSKIGFVLSTVTTVAG